MGQLETGMERLDAKVDRLDANVSRIERKLDQVIETETNELVERRLQRFESRTH